MITPPEWDFDDSGHEQGIFLAQDPLAWNGQFHPNIAVIQRPAENPQHTVESLMEEQLQLDRGLADALTDYRILHLDEDHLGVDETPAILRVASYRNEEDVPLTLYQWVAIRAGYEYSFAVTFPTANYPDWANAVLMMGWGLEWKET